MIARYLIEARTSAGVRLDMFTDYKELHFTRVLNDIGIARIVIQDDHRVINKLEQDSVIVIWRWHPDVQFGIPDPIFAGLYQGVLNKLDARADSTVEIIVPDGNILMQRSINAFKAGVNDRTSFTNAPVVIILSNLLTYNIKTGDPGVRLIDPVTGGGTNRIGLSSFPTGDSISYSGAYKNILTEVQALCDRLGLYWRVDFSSAATNEFSLAFFFGFYAADKALFDVQRANLINSEFDARNVDEVTKVLVLGQGEGSNRVTQVRTGTRYSLFNHIETVINASEISSTSELQALGDIRLRQGRFLPKYRFEAVQAPGTRWGVDYSLGDIIATRWNNTTILQIIHQLSVSVTAEGETVSIGLKAVEQPEVSDSVKITESVSVVRI